MIRAIFHLIVVALLTALTQIGGIAYLLALLLRRSFLGRVFGLALLYPLISIATAFIAPSFGREPLPCFERETIFPRTLMTCALNRHFVTPELRALANDLALHMQLRHDLAPLIYLDASFPFFDGFPLLPHLSHDDGKKLDLAFFYTDNKGNYVSGETPSPLGYWGFLEPHAEDPKSCRDGKRLTLRWDMGWFQRFVRDDLVMDTDRTATMLRWLSDEALKGGIEKILLEPHLRARFALPPSVVRFQGCRAARHDDHVHIQVR